MRHAGPRQRQAQPPDAGEHALAAPDLASVASACASAGTLTSRAMAADATGRRRRRYFDGARARATSTPPRRAGRPTASTTSSARPTRRGPDGVRAYFGELFAAVPDFTFGRRDDRRRGRPRARCAGARPGTFAGRARLPGHRADRRPRRRSTGLDLLQVRDGLIVRNDAVHRRPDHRAPDRAAAAAGLGRRDAAAQRAFNAKTRGRAAARGHRRRAGRRRRVARARRRPAAR